MGNSGYTCTLLNVIVGSGQSQLRPWACLRTSDFLDR